MGGLLPVGAEPGRSHVWDLWCTGWAWRWPAAAISFRVRMAPSPGRLGLLLLWHWCCGLDATWLPAEPPWHAPDICPDEPGEPSLPSIGRRQRRQLTKIVTIVWSAHPPGHSFLRKPRLRGGGGSEGSGSVRLPTLALRHLARLYILPFKAIALAALRMSLGPHAAA